MGTRNITRVIHNGQVKVCQYGQWDGYPTYTGKKVLEFIRDTDMKEFAKKVDSCTFNLVKDDGERTYTSAPYLEEIFNLHDGILYGNNELSINERKQLAEEKIIEKYGEEGYAQYLVATRDTGVRILDVIMKYAPLNLYADEYLMGGTDWQIEAVNEIDLDKEEVRMDWHGVLKRIKFNNIPKYIDKSMERYEEKA